MIHLTIRVDQRKLKCKEERITKYHSRMEKFFNACLFFFFNNIIILTEQLLDEVEQNIYFITFYVYIL